MVGRRFLWSLILLVGTSCDNPAGPELSVLAVTPATAEIVVGDTIRLTAIGLSSAGDTIHGLLITWASSDTLVVTVSSTGLVTARGPGAATITAASGAISGPASIDVRIHFASVTAGADHDCGLTAAGVAYCWGENYSGQLGDGSTTARATATAVVGGHRFLAVAAGSSFTCGIDTDSVAWCWGLNGGGTLGIGTTDELPHSAPVQALGGHHFRDFSATGSHTCALTAQGDAYCWGAGRLGTGTSPDSIVPSPRLVEGGFAFNTLQTSVGHSCGVTPGNATLCWGFNSDGQLGAVTDTAFTTPTSVGDTLALAGVSAGGEQACGLQAGGAAICWGGMEVGEGYWVRRHPQRVEPTRSFTQITATFTTACGVDLSSAAWCWGSNWFGELGDGTEHPRLPGVMVSGGHAFSSVATGDSHTCGLDVSGAAYCWGANYSGELGTGTFGGNSAVPVPVSGGIAFRSIVGASSYTCGIAVDSTAWCWGTNSEGQLGDSSTTNRAQPVMVRGGLKFVDLAAGGSQYYAFTCGVTATGVAYCWGDGSKGQLGTGVTDSSTVPVAVTGGLSFTRIAAGRSGNSFACGVTSGGSAYCWGANRFGTLGRGDTVSSSAPVAVAGGLTFTDIAAGSAFACGRTGGAAVYCWGNNTGGQMAQGSLGIESLRPIPAVTPTPFTRVAVGQLHSCGLAADSTAWCWGRNREGQLGTGDSVSGRVPRAVAGGLHFKLLALSYLQSCGLTGAGAAYCWGWDGAPTPQAIQPEHSFLMLSGSPVGRVCGVRSDSAAVCISELAGAAPRRAVTAAPPLRRSLLLRHTR